MKHTRFALAAGTILSLMLLAACGQSTGKDVLLHLTFDEGSGTAVADAAGQRPEAEVEYRMFSGLMDELTLYSRALTADETAPPERCPISLLRISAWKTSSATISTKRSTTADPTSTG